MGLSHVEAASLQARLTPHVTIAEPAGPGHRRGQTPKADKTDVGLRGIPVIGHGSGAIANSAPGGEIGAAARLDRDGRELVRRRMKSARSRLSNGGAN